MVLKNMHPKPLRVLAKTQKTFHKTEKPHETLQKLQTQTKNKNLKLSADVFKDFKNLRGEF